jgi:hypothetical protein
MRRRAFDAIVSWVGVVVTAALLVAGALMLAGSLFANNNVHNELAAQQIYFPAAGSQALASSDIGPFLNRYVGQQLVNGPQAKAWADHFIAVHLKEVAGGQTYAQVSAKAQANPTDATLKAQVDTLFRGETLRGMLLNAYAFWEIGHLALLGAIAAFIMAVLAGILTGLGFWHSRKVSPHQTLLTPAVPASV